MDNRPPQVATWVEEHYRAYVRHVQTCSRCRPGRCAAGQALCRAYLAALAGDEPAGTEPVDRP
ncbi:hypothetical protein GCM10010277_86060 [Streptomyces longisporoflavus]|nr:hypothetical protein GCM10010277_86060 [Streptomyces longisporoflavus]